MIPPAGMSVPVAMDLTARDYRRLAALHLEALPDSIVAELGPRYAESFYRYLARSTKERIFVVRDESGSVMSACVLSLRPHTLRCRLLFHTTLLFHAGPVLWRRWSRRKPAHSAKTASLPDPVPEHVPELILIFTAGESRSRGTGAHLLQQCEEFLKQARLPEYAVRTVDEPGNRALHFYQKNGFVPYGQSTDRGRVFRVFTRKVAGTA